MSRRSAVARAKAYRPTEGHFGPLEEKLEVHVFENVPFALDPLEVHRLLSYVPGRRPPTRPILQRIEEMISESRTLIEPRGAYAIRRLKEAPATGPFRGAEMVAYCVCTIGKKLENRVAELSKKGEPLRALILDAVGSASVEAVTDVVNAAICERIGQKDLFTNRRISPGYRGWSIEAQKEIFELIPTRFSGVTLRPTFFMDPRKSISAAISVGRDVPHSKYVTICAYCNLTGCQFRRQPEPGQSESTHT